MSNLTQYLQKYNQEGLQKLKDELHIKHSRHKTIPNLILFKYNQALSPFFHPIVQEARGIILDENENWRIVSFPYKKFFNWKESLAAPIDWDNPVRLYEKIDGSLFTLYYYEGTWHVSTSGLPDASGPLPRKHGSTKCFSEAFWETFHNMNYRLPTQDDIRKCFMFEFASPENHVVVAYTTAKIYCHGVRDLDTLEEAFSDVYCSKYGWESVPYRLLDGGEAEIVSFIASDLKSLNAFQLEGYVLCDWKFNRNKLKCPNYVAISIMSSSDPKKITWRSLLKVLLSNEASEFLTYFPELADRYNNLSERYQIISRALQLAEERVNVLDKTESIRAWNKLPSWMIPYIEHSRWIPHSIQAFFRKNEKILASILDPNSSLPEIPNWN